MYRWLTDLYLTICFFLVRASIRREVAERARTYDARATTEAASRDATPQASEMKDCVVKQGWSAVCCCAGCAPARCSTLVEGDSRLTFVMRPAGECAKLARQGVPSCRTGV